MLYLDFLMLNSDTALILPKYQLGMFCKREILHKNKEGALFQEV